MQVFRNSVTYISNFSQELAFFKKSICERNRTSINASEPKFSLSIVLYPRLFFVLSDALESSKIACGSESPALETKELNSSSNGSRSFKK